MIETSLFGRGVLECSLEVTEVLRGGGRRWWRHEAGLHVFWKEDLDMVVMVMAIVIVYTVSQKKRPTLWLSISSSNI